MYDLMFVQMEGVVASQEHIPRGEYTRGQNYPDTSVCNFLNFLSFQSHIYIMSKFPFLHLHRAGTYQTGS